MYSESKRIEYLDSVRGLAAIFVLLYHTAASFAWPASYTAMLHAPFLSIAFNGQEAVCMFFVLSGFVLSKPYVPSTKYPSPRTIFLPTFYLRRLTRIWLPWFFFFVASIFARRYLFYRPLTEPPPTDWLNQFWSSSLTMGDFFRQCAFVSHDGSRQLLNQDWSLAVELKGSLLIPLFVFLLRYKRIAVPFGIAIAYPILAGTGHDYFFYVSFVLGVLLARYGEALAGRLTRSGWPAKAFFFMAGLSLYQTLSWVFPFCHGVSPLYKIGWVGTSFGCALILLCSFSVQPLQELLSCKPFVFLGRISYSVYLVQFIVILCLLPPVVHWFNACGIFNRPLIFVLTLITCAAVAIVCSAVTYRLVEVPAIKFGHELTKKMQSRFGRQAG